LDYKKLIRRKLFFLLFFSLLLVIYSTSFIKADNNDTKDKKIILIDPGHGGYDGGASGKSKIQEKDINLSISLELRKQLQSEGYEVYMIREDDRALLDIGPRKGTKKAQDIANRCKIKKEVNPDIFISIHQNHFPQSKYYGSQVWYSKNKESRMLGRIMQQNLKEDIDPDNRRIEKAAKDDYKILCCEDDMASVLIETGFLSNYEEEQKLLSEDYQQKIAKSITKSVKQYFKSN
jgi:N-acetylmuramoyl-L-alanine amidase